MRGFASKWASSSAQMMMSAAGQRSRSCRATRSRLAAVIEAGATVLPASPSFYSAPATVQDLVDTVVARVLDHLDVEHELSRRWEGTLMGGSR